MYRGKSVCFSGHRRVHFDMDDSFLGEKMQKALKHSIQTAINEGFTAFYTGMAQGFDIIAGEAVIQTKYSCNTEITLFCIVPYRGQETKWSKKWRQRHDQLLKNGEIICLNDSYITGCFHERNKYLVDNSARLIGLYSGKSSGTRHTFDYAEKSGLEIINIWDKLEDNYERTND